MVAAHKGGGDDVGPVQQVGVDLHFEGGDAVAQAGEVAAQGFALAEGAAAALRGSPAQLPPQAPQLGVGGVPLEAPLVGEGQHLVGHPHGVPYAEHAQPPVRKLLGYPVDGGVALGADQHLRLAAEGLVDGLDEGGGLARARGAVHDGHVPCAQDAVDGCLLCRVQPGQAHGVQLAEAGRDGAQEDVAQLGQAVAAGPGHVFQRLEHGAVTRLVQGKLYAQGPCVLHLEHGSRPGHDRGHAAVVGIAHRALRPEVLHLAVGRLAEEAYRPPVLEAVFGGVVFRAGKFQDELVQRVVVTAAGGDGVPAQAALHVPGHAHGFGLAAELFFLVFVLHAQQHLLALQVQGRALGLLCFHGRKGT